MGFSLVQDVLSFLQKQHTRSCEDQQLCSCSGVRPLFSDLWPNVMAPQQPNSIFEHVCPAESQLQVFPCSWNRISFYIFTEYER